MPKPVQRPSGLWIAQLTLNGRRTTVSAPTEAEYYAKARALKAGLIEAAAPAPRKTLDAVVSGYIAKNSNTLSPTTLRSYKGYWANHFGKYHSRQISTIDWQEMVNAEAATTGAALLRKCWYLVHAALASEGIAVEVKLKAAPKKERPWLSDAEIVKFLEAVKGQPCELTALIALHSLRLSEIGGLRWEDYDGKSLRVHGALVRGEHGWIEKDTPKSRAGNRVIPIFIPRLKELLDAVPAEERSGRIVRTNTRTDTDRIRRSCERSGLPPCTAHCLRHSFATLCHRLRIPLLECKRLGGWDDIETLQRIYTHLDEQDALTSQTTLKDFFANYYQKTTI